MILSRKHKFVFIHNPKVGGTSIRKALEQYHDVPDKFWHQGWDSINQRIQDCAHIPMHDLHRIYRDWMAQPDVFIFGFVRNPIARFWSSLAEFRRQHADWWPSQLPTNEFIRCFLTEANVRYDWRFVHFCPQHYFLSDWAIPPTFIGRHENFKADWETIKEKLGVPIPELNNERHRVNSEPELLTSDSLEILHRLYNFDCITFGYPPILDSPACDTHEYRISQIHDYRCMRSQTLEAKLTPGERIAYQAKLKT